MTGRGRAPAIEAARRAGRVLSAAGDFRRDPINRLVRAPIDDGAVGTPRPMPETTIGGRDAIAIIPGAT